MLFYLKKTSISGKGKQRYFGINSDANKVSSNISSAKIIYFVSVGLQ